DRWLIDGSPRQVWKVLGSRFRFAAPCPSPSSSRPTPSARPVRAGRGSSPCRRSTPWPVLFPSAPHEAVRQVDLVIVRGARVDSLMGRGFILSDQEGHDAKIRGQSDDPNTACQEC